MSEEFARSVNASLFRMKLQLDIRKTLGRLLPEEDTIKIYKGSGCKECNNTGYLGRIGIFEMLYVTPAIARLIFGKASAEQIEVQAIADGMITLKQDGYFKVISGITSVDEIIRVTKE